MWRIVDKKWKWIACYQALIGLETCWEAAVAKLYVTPVTEVVQEKIVLMKCVKEV